jgi:hypothetical protein
MGTQVSKDISKAIFTKISMKSLQNFVEMLFRMHLDVDDPTDVIRDDTQDAEEPTHQAPNNENEAAEIGAPDIAENNDDNGAADALDADLEQDYPLTEEENEPTDDDSEADPERDDAVAPRA